MPTHSIGNFGEQIQKWADKAGLGVDKLTRSVLIELSTDIIKLTPVDTGRAKSNWFPSIGAPSNLVDMVSEPDDKTPLKAIDSSSEQKIDSTVINAAGEVYYLVNNLPYIGKLEYDGHSKQAPQGMVRISLTDVERRLRQAASEL